VLTRIGPFLFAVSLLFFSGSAAYVAQQHWFKPVLVCQQTEADLGIITVGDPSNCHFQVRNEGRQPLRIRDVKPTCGACIQVVRWPQSPIAPGEADEIELELLTVPLRGPVVKTVSITSNDPSQSPAILKVRAVVVARLPESEVETDESPRPLVAIRQAAQEFDADSSAANDSP